MPKVVQQTTKPSTKKKGGVLGRIRSVQEHSQEEMPFLKINLYGKSGTGKSTLMASAPKPLLIIGAEDGTKSISNVKGVDFIRIDSSSEISELCEHVRDSGKYVSVGLDTASSLQDLILKEILGLSELPAQKSWGMASRDQYGQCALQTKERLREVLNLNCHVIITAQEREFNTDGDADEILMPYVASALSPSVVGWLNPACDYLCETFIRKKTKEKQVKIGGKTKTIKERAEGVEYCLRVAPDDVYTVKFRLPKGSYLPPVLVDPTFEKIMTLVLGKGEKGKI